MVLLVRALINHDYILEKAYNKHIIRREDGVVGETSVSLHFSVDSGETRYGIMIYIAQILTLISMLYF